jgi:hydroxyethylthiazole kinase-like uncharacterized protein yjeF
MNRSILNSHALRLLEYTNRSVPLMERAGAAAAALVTHLNRPLRGKPLIFAGPGNNGGDAFVAARLLRQQGLDPTVVYRGDPARLPPDATAAHEKWLAAGGQCLTDVPMARHGEIGEYGVVVDGLFGIGLVRPIEGDYAALVERINAYRGPVLALDCPSGLDGDTGRAHGTAVRATHTLSFIALKPGQLTLDGPDHCGEISVADLGLDAASGEDAGRVPAPADFAPWLKPRRRNSHKGSHGSVGIVGGARGMAGAALLAGRAALHLGAGRVYVGMLERLPVDTQQAELMLRAPEEVFDLATVLAVGPGLGQSEQAMSLLRKALAADLPLLLDADALNLLAQHPVVLSRLERRQAPTLLTPHPTEAARLLGTNTAEVQADRLSAARELAQRHRAAVVLKGCGSVVVAPDRRWYINTSGNPGMASAGQGDILSGLTAALLAQGWPPDSALTAAVHLHGAAADAAVAAGIGPVGLVAGETIEAARRLFNRWIADSI